jgi:hypothetical protein
MTEQKKSFWSGLSGALAAITALLTAVGALIAVLVQVGVIGGDDGGNAGGGGSGTTTTPAMVDWAGKANEACERANELIDELPDAERVDPSEGLGLAERALSINRQMVRELTKLPKPEEERKQIMEFLRLGAGINESTEEAIAAVKALNIAAVQERQAEISTFGRKFDAAAVELGASTCAEGSSYEAGLPSAGG